ncbi:hypothetical protein H5410_017785 [Solanum commersonii]|uniref:Uncharacterized protein n=1 Tax=Solanum commersonii TaxID=4109 RepID=A0A9J6A097_SOLCO|nr:hypothetical protein H5410_017785 [Solanum commersonii]
MPFNVLTIAPCYSGMLEPPRLIGYRMISNPSGQFSLVDYDVDAELGFEELKTVNLHSIYVNKLHTIARSYLRKTLLELKIFALKAQNRFPGLDGLSQFLEVVAVYVAHDKKTYGVKIPTASNSVQYNLVILALAQQLEQTFRRIKFLRRAMQIVCMPLQLGKLHTPASQLVET